jgi:hypothetical protein
MTKREGEAMDDEPATATYSKAQTFHWEDEKLPDGTILLPPILDEPVCDYCGWNFAIDGWHTIVDPEGIEGDQRVPCARVASSDSESTTEGWVNMRHLLGWFELLPLISDEECPVCHAAPGELHQITTLGKAQTIRLLLESGA